MKMFKLVLASVALSLLSSVAISAEAESDVDSSQGIMKMDGPVPVFTSKDGRYMFRPTGRIHVDTALYEQGEVGIFALNPDLNSGTNFRRARFGVTGLIDKDFKYALSFDAGDNGQPGDTVTLDVAYVSYVKYEPLRITVGRHKSPGGFSEASSSNNLNFMERSLAHNVALGAGGGKRVGSSISIATEQWRVHTGIFGNRRFSNDIDEQIGINGRISSAFINTETLLFHLGASAYFIFDPSQDNPRSIVFSDQPEIRVDSTEWIVAASQPVFSNNNGWMVGLEFAGKAGPLWLQTEYFNFGMDQDPRGAAVTANDVAFESLYIETGYILTGETKPYSYKRGSWKGVTPNHPVTEGGIGAWEIAARYSWVDLNDDENSFSSNGQFIGVRGGEQTNYTLGLNWYLNNYMRTMVNYVHADVDRLSDTGEILSDTFQVYAARLQIKF